MNDRVATDAQPVISPLQALDALNRAYPEPPPQAPLPLSADGEPLPEPLALSVPDVMHDVVQSLTTAFEKLATSISEFSQKLANLDVQTFSVSNLQLLQSEQNALDFLKQSGQLVAWTRISLDGDVTAALPEQDGKLNQPLWSAHKDLVDLAQANRAAMIKAAVDSLVTLITPTKAG